MMAKTDSGLNPGISFELVGRRSLAEQAHHTQIGDGVGVAVGGCRVIPGFGAPVVPGHPPTRVVRESDQKLCSDAAGFGGLKQMRKSVARIGARQPAVEFARGVRS